ncbi:MAG TPA: hypothetical protein VIY47_16130 [Ignavibacteriaceae bacterium]
MKYLSTLLVLLVASIISFSQEKKDLDHMTKQEKEVYKLEKRISESKSKLLILEASLGEKITRSEMAKAEAHNAADDNADIAKKLNKDQTSKKWARKSQKAAKNAKRDAKSARKADDSLESLRDNIESEKKKIASAEEKLAKARQTVPENE